MRYMLSKTLGIAVSLHLLVSALVLDRLALADMHRPSVESAGAETAHSNVTVLDEVWTRVRDSFYDPKLRGLDWEKIGKQYRLQVAEPGTDLALVTNRMLDELGVSHTGYYTPDETAYYDLADIFSGGLRRDLPRYFPKGEVS